MSKKSFLRKLPMIALLLFVVIGCKSLQSLGKPTVLANKDGKFQLTVPAGWHEDSTLNAEADIKASNRLKEQYVIVLTESKKDFSNDMTLDKFTDITRKAMIAKMTSAESTEPAPVAINGSAGRQYELQGELNSVRLAYVITGVIARACPKAAPTEWPSQCRRVLESEHGRRR